MSRKTIRRIAIRAALIGVGVLAVRALAPKLHARLLAACERVFEQAPNDFPPKRMLRGIEEIRVNSARTVQLLEERKLAAEPEARGDASTKAATHAALRNGKGHTSGERVAV
jgi:hypothetical protein